MRYKIIILFIPLLAFPTGYAQQRMGVVTVLLVDHITFADGSTYDARKASQALVDFFEKFDP